MFTSHILISLSLNIIRICFMYMCIYVNQSFKKFVCLIVNFKPADIFYHVTFNPGLVKFGGKN